MASDGECWRVMGIDGECCVGYSTAHRPPSPCLATHSRCVMHTHIPPLPQLLSDKGHSPTWRIGTARRFSSSSQQADMPGAGQTLAHVAQLQYIAAMWHLPCTIPHKCIPTQGRTTQSRTTQRVDSSCQIAVRLRWCRSGRPHATRLLELPSHASTTWALQAVIAQAPERPYH